MSLAKRILIYVCILSYTHFGMAQDVVFQWLNKDTKHFEKFNLSKAEFSSSYISNNNVTSTFPIKIQNLDLRDFPQDKTINTRGFNVDKKITYFTFPGTGYVFLFDRIQRTLTRIDETFYRGYNFESVQFFKNGTIYSLGGSGFWKINAVLAYYDFKRKEWEYQDTKGDIKPERILAHLSGVDLSKNKIYVLEARKEFLIHSNGKQRVFELDLNTFTWTYKGDIDLEKMTDLDLISTDVTWLGGLFYFHHKPENAILANPETNELYVYEGKKKLFFGPDKYNFYLDNVVYSKMPQFTKGKTVEVIDSLTMADLRKDLVKIGTLYDQNWFPYNLKDISLGFFSLFSLGSILFFVQRRSKNRKNSKKQRVHLVSHEKSVWELLSPAGVAILDYVMEHGCDYMFTTEEISKLLGCDKKAFDTQRQYRSKFISNFNAFFEEHFMLNDAIYRISSDEDKRFVCYQLSEEVVKEYKSYLKSLD